MKVPAVVKGEPKPSSHGDGDGDDGEREGANGGERESEASARGGTEGVRRDEHCAAVTLAPLGGFAPCTSGSPSGQNGPTRMNSRRLHSGKRSVRAFLGMQAAAPILHSPSLVTSLCNPPNNHGLHCTSLGRPYTAYQTAPICLVEGG
jgi:hypothetical protein